MSNFTKITPEQLDINAFAAIGSDWMLLSAGDEEKANAMTASWGGLGVMWGKNAAFIVIRPTRFTKEFVDAKDFFSLSFLDPKKYRKQQAYFGAVSGRDEDKFQKSGLELDFENGTPYFKDAGKVLICKKMFAQPYLEDSFIDKSLIEQWYPIRDYHTLYIGEVTDILVK